MAQVGGYYATMCRGADILLANSENVRALQDDIYFNLAFLKEKRFGTLRSRLLNNFPAKVFLSSNFWRLVVNSSIWSDENLLSHDYFIEKDAVNRAINKKRLEGAVVIINNNDLHNAELMQGYADFYDDCAETCFVGWDWDNHHWLEVSTFMAAHTDIYCPAHHENLYLLSRFNNHIAGPVYCSTDQWSRKYLTDNLSRILESERSDKPLGMHVAYPKFGYRMRVLASLNGHFHDTVGFAGNYRQKTADERLEEWVGHKVHFIVPVLNDVPIRLFDALATGGVPIVPVSMSGLAPVSAIPDEYIEYYSAEDLLNPSGVVARAVSKFYLHGKDGIVCRHRYALSNHHAEASIASMIEISARALNKHA